MFRLNFRWPDKEIYTSGQWSKKFFEPLVYVMNLRDLIIQ
jgi:hypothetical protein